LPEDLRFQSRASVRWSKESFAWLRSWRIA
jgi:hypothetical protein